MNLTIIDSGKRSAKEQMQIDEAYLLGVDTPMLRFYDWNGFSITYGYFIDPAQWLDVEALDHARRPTGGGLLFHEHDLSFTLMLPHVHPFCELPVLQRYQTINASVGDAIQQLLPEVVCSLQTEEVEKEPFGELCMAHPTKYDLLQGKKKIGGASQRKNRRAFIHQCSLFLVTPDWDKIAKRLKCRETFEKLQSTSCALFSTPQESDDFRSELKNLFPKVISLIL